MTLVVGGMLWYFGLLEDVEDEDQGKDGKATTPTFILQKY